MHFISGGSQLDYVQLNDAAEPRGVYAPHRRKGARTERPGEWVLGGDWDETKWSPAAIPTKEMIDSVTPATPVFVNRYDGHMGLANSVALKLAGITQGTPDPPGGAIVRDAQGNPTGC